MADPELVQVMDYILNRCDEKSIEAVAAAVVRRRRDLALFGGMGKLPDPKKLARDFSAQIYGGSGIKDLKNAVRSMAERIIRQEAPELSGGEAAELLDAWIPGQGTGEALKRDLLTTMVGQFISFSLGRMDEKDDQELRAEMGAWPDRYWKSFPPGVRRIITGFLKGEMTEGEFNAKIGAVLDLDGPE